MLNLSLLYSISKYFPITFMKFIDTAARNKSNQSHPIFSMWLEYLIHYYIIFCVNMSKVNYNTPYPSYFSYCYT